jgi:hypothetical protein
MKNTSAVVLKGSMPKDDSLWNKQRDTRAPDQLFDVKSNSDQSALSPLTVIIELLIVQINKLIHFKLNTGIHILTSQT